MQEQQQAVNTVNASRVRRLSGPKFGTIIRDARILRGLSQKDVAKSTGIPAATLSRIEANAFGRTPDRIDKLIEFLEVDKTVFSKVIRTAKSKVRGNQPLKTKRSKKSRAKTKKTKKVTADSHNTAQKTEHVLKVPFLTADAGLLSSTDSPEFARLASGVPESAPQISNVLNSKNEEGRYPLFNVIKAVVEADIKNITLDNLRYLLHVQTALSSDGAVMTPDIARAVLQR